MSDWLEDSDNANTLKSSYIQGVLDVSGNIIMRNSDQAFISMSDASFNRKFHALKNTAIGKEVDNLENALDVSGNVGITGSLVLEETPTIYSGSLNTDQLSIEGNLITTGGTAQVASKNVTYDTHLNVHGSTITANTSELNHMNKFFKYQIHSDISMVNATESFGEDVSLNAALTVPGNILIVDSSNSEYNYGAYTIHTDETYTNYFAVGKSASNVFNIVNNNNAGVYMDSGSNSFTGTSDERLKKNIEEIGDESNEKVKQLRPVTYQWKHQTHDKSQAGFIAQEVEKVLPELVKENDSVDGSTYKGVSSDDLIPYLVKYVQKLRKKLEILKETKLKKKRKFK
jgi:hypothetical protein